MDTELTQLLTIAGAATLIAIAERRRVARLLGWRAQGSGGAKAQLRAP
jgi:hypothetical protein